MVVKVAANKLGNYRTEGDLMHRYVWFSWYIYEMIETKMLKVMSDVFPQTWIRKLATVNGRILWILMLWPFHHSY